MRFVVATLTNNGEFLEELREELDGKVRSDSVWCCEGRHLLTYTRPRNCLHHSLRVPMLSIHLCCTPVFAAVPPYC